MFLLASFDVVCFVLVVVGYLLLCSCGLCLTFFDNELGDAEHFHVVILLCDC